MANVGVDVRACVLHWDPLERVTAHDVDEDAAVGLHTFVVFLYRPPHTVFTDPDLVILRIDLPEADYSESEIDGSDGSDGIQ